MSSSPSSQPRPGQAPTASAHHHHGRYLVLLDMNGTLCYRSDNPIPGGANTAPCDLYVRNKFFYGRKGIVNFVDTLYKSGAFCLVPFSSMIQDSSQAGVWARIPPGMRAMFPPTSITHFHCFLQGDTCKPDPEMDKPDPEWDTICDMDKVWKELPGFGPERTLLLDNDTRKFRDAPRNGILVPEYGPRQIQQEDHTTLDDLLAYLLRIADEQPDDVRDYLEAHPFENFREQRAAESAMQTSPQPASRTEGHHGAQRQALSCA